MTQEEIAKYIRTEFKSMSLPDSFQKLAHLLNDANSNLDDIVMVIRHDPELAASILRLANSPQYSFGEPVSSVELAASRIGFQEVERAALAFGILSTLKLEEKRFPLLDFWKRCMTVAYIAQSLPDYMNIQDRSALPAPNKLFTAGLLHDIGLLVMVHGFSDTILTYIDLALELGKPLHEVEQIANGFTHQEAGQLLCDEWKLPLSVQSVAKFHHCPEKTENPMHLPAVSIVHIADYVCTCRAIEEGVKTLQPDLNEDVWNASGIDKAQLPDIIDKARKSAEIVEQILVLT